MEKQSYFVISLDFELMWGMFDKVSIESYGENISGVHQAIPELLQIFRAQNIHATWATVGMLMYENADALQSALPTDDNQPQYPDQNVSSYNHFKNIEGHAAKTKYYFAPDLVRLILDTPGQELASHTFSHYYCLDGSENGEAIFAADCQAQKTTFARYNQSPTSIIFPRNQTTDNALKVCREHGINCYRGTENHFLYRARTEDRQSNVIIRGLRLLDHYLNLSGHHTYQLPPANDLINISASRFLRPHSPTLNFFESLRMRRIKNAMTHAAKHGEVFHLWWHPHNFGSNRKENMANLLDILRHFQNLQEQYGMRSANMRELATRGHE